MKHNKKDTQCAIVSKVKLSELNGMGPRYIVNIWAGEPKNSLMQEERMYHTLSEVRSFLMVCYPSIHRSANIWPYAMKKQIEALNG